VLFFRQSQDHLSVGQLNQRTLASISVSTLVVLCLATSVSAFYFEFYYFETDKLVYEVGETIDMVAKLIAEFSQDGWCYVSFSVMTDQGPVFADSYSIPSSPDIRYLNNSYVIRPEDTSPGADGTIGYVIFNVEVYDGYSQGGGDAIEINITRGTLEATPQSSTDIEYGFNGTLEFKLTSIHNSDVVSANCPTSLTLYDEFSTVIVSENTTTDANGLFQLDWEESFGPPGTYSLEVSTNGTNSFLPLLDSIPINVLPAFSNLTLISAPSTISCETPDGSYAELFDIEVQHTSVSGVPLNDSSIQWTTAFSSGEMNNLGGGLYSISIPFHTGPGINPVNLTATNPLYQPEFLSMSVDVTKRSITMIATYPEDHVSGTPLTIGLQLTDSVTGFPVESYPLSVDVIIDSATVDSIANFTDNLGQLQLILNIPPMTWGSGVVQITGSSTTHYTTTTSSLDIDFHFTPEVSYQIIEPAALGHIAEISVILETPLKQPIMGANLQLLNETGYILATGISDSYGVAQLLWTVSLDTEVRLHDYALIVLADESQYLSENTSSIALRVHYSLFFIPSETTWIANRNSEAAISFIVDSEWTFNQSVVILLNDTTGDFSHTSTIFTDALTNIEIPIGSQVTLGVHRVLVSIETDDYIILGFCEIEIIVIGQIDGDVEISTIYYGENWWLNLSLLYDNNETATSVDISIYIDGSTTPTVSIDDCNTSSPIYLSFPSWILPGSYSLLFQLTAEWCISMNYSTSTTVWMRTIIEIIIGNPDPEQSLIAEPIEDQPSAPQPSISFSNSAGSIINPPPIFVKDTTSTSSPTALDTSPDSCPRLSSGTSKRPTDRANSRIDSSGNGQITLGRKDLIVSWLEFFAISSSTALEVHPYETIPHSASSGPSTTKSVRTF